jgi:hypothetical protein
MRLVSFRNGDEAHLKTGRLRVQFREFAADWAGWVDIRFACKQRKSIQSHHKVRIAPTTCICALAGGVSPELIRIVSLRI